MIKPKKRILLFYMLLVGMIMSTGGSVFSETYIFTQNTPFVWGGTTVSSVLGASGVAGNVTDVNVTLNGLKVNNFVFGLREFDILLVGPQGQKLSLMAFACDSTPGPLDLTFDDAAAGPLPSGISGTSCGSGTFLPSDYSAIIGGHFLDSPPAPAPPYSVNMADFEGQNANGTWSLYAEEFGGTEGGTINNWTLTIQTDSVATCTYQNDFNDGVLEWIEEKPTVTETGGFLNLTPLKRKAIAVADATFGVQSTGTYTYVVNFTGGTFSKNWLYISRVDKKNQVEVLAKIDQGKVVIKDRFGSVLQKAKGTFKFAPNTPYTFVTNYDGINIDVSINGTPVIVDFVPSRVLPSGNTGATAKLNAMSIDSFCFE
jgi:hypothetical protein